MSSTPSPRAALSDEALIQAVVHGEARVADELCDRLVGVIGQTILRITGTRGPDYEDLIQATFEQVVTTLMERRFAGACSLSTWASSLAAHVSLNALRSRKVERRVLDFTTDLERHGEIAASGDVERHAGARERFERVRQCLARMNPQKAEAVVLHDILGHDLAEIAVITGVSVAAAQSRLVRGRAELLKRLQKHEIEQAGR